MLSGDGEVNERTTTSICDALLAPTPAVLPFSINKRRLSGVVTSNESNVLRAMRLAFDEFRVVVEPGGAVGLASPLTNPEMLRGRNAVVIASGGNVDPQLFLRALQET